MVIENPYRARGTFIGRSYIEREADFKLKEAIKDNDRYSFFLHRARVENQVLWNERGAYYRMKTSILLSLIFQLFLKRKWLIIISSS